MKLKHAPGPWKWFDYPSGVKLLAANPRAVIHCPYPMSIYPEDQALIACAPEMLEELLNSYRIVSTLPCECDEYEGFTCGFHAWQRGLRDIIERATGMSIEEVMK